MRIGVRVFGGFAAGLALTGAVAMVAWQSLGTFATGAATATAAERLSTESSSLALAALGDASDRKSEAMRHAVGRARTAIQNLAELGTGEAGIRNAVTTLSAAVTSVEQGATELDKRQLESKREHDQHAKLVDDILVAVDGISAAQKARLEKALKAVDDAQVEQTQLSTIVQLTSHALRLAYEMRLNDEDQLSRESELQKAKTTPVIFGALLTRIAAVPALAETVKPAVVAHAQYREVHEAILAGRDRIRELSPLSERIIAALNAVDGRILNLQSEIRGRVGEARDQVSLAIDLLSLSASAVTAAKTMQVEELQLMASASEADAKKMDRAAAQLLEDIQNLGFRVSEPELLSVITDLRGKVTGYRKSIPDALATKLDSNALKAKLGATAADMVKRAQEVGTARLQEMESGRQQALWLLGSGVAVALLVGLLLAFAIGRSITKPVNALVAAMRRLVEGDLSAEVPGEARRDELGEMAKAVVTFKEAAIDKRRVEGEAAAERQRADAERRASEAARAEAAQKQALVVTSVASGLSHLASGDLRHRLETEFAPEYEQLRTDFNAAVDTLHSTVETIAGSAATIRQGTGEIRQAADDLSQRTEQQAASLEQSAAALDEISSTTRKAAGSAGQAKTLVGNAASEADRSGEVVRQAITAMGKIEDSSNKIARIVSVIDEIAFQTNLLALNAGVEAARAGDSGKGFAVVAQEVRSLAQRSAEAAKEIEALIQSSSRLVEDGVKLVGDAGSALMRISGHVGQINVAVADIATSAEEQAVGLGQVNTAVGQMGQMTQQNAAMVEESTAASHNLAGEVEELDRLLGHFQLRNQARIEAARAVASAPAPRPAPQPLHAPARKPVVQGNLALAPQDDWEEF